MIVFHTIQGEELLQSNINIGDTIIWGYVQYNLTSFIKYYCVNYCVPYTAGKHVLIPYCAGARLLIDLLVQIKR